MHTGNEQLKFGIKIYSLGAWLAREIARCGGAGCRASYGVPIPEAAD